MAAYRRVYDARHLQADCQEPGSALVIEYGLPLPLYSIPTQSKAVLESGWLCVRVQGRSASTAACSRITAVAARSATGDDACVLTATSRRRRRPSAPGVEVSIYARYGVHNSKLYRLVQLKKGKGSPYSITERRVPELIPVLCSQRAGDVGHKPGGRLPLLSTRPAVTPATLKRVLLLGEQRHNGCEQFA